MPKYDKETQAFLRRLSKKRGKKGPPTPLILEDLPRVRHTRPRKYTLCPHYGPRYLRGEVTTSSHQFSPGSGRCACGETKKQAKLKKKK